MSTCFKPLSDKGGTGRRKRIKNIYQMVGKITICYSLLCLFQREQSASAQTSCTKLFFSLFFFLVPFFHISFFVCLHLPSILHISVSLAWVSLYKKHVYHNEGEKVSPYKTSKESKKLPCGSLISVKEHFL